MGIGRFTALGAVLLLAAAGVGAQEVERVRPDEAPNQIQIGGSVSFVRFNEVPNSNLNNFGVNASLVDYGNRLGAEGQVSDSFSSQSGQTSRLFFAGGGVRFRLTTIRQIQPWIHFVAGYAQVSPTNVSYGDHSGIADKVGGGVDFIPRHGRLSFRASADMFNTNFFRTYQLSPEISVGVVFRLDRWGQMPH
jgi:hypothetical protein